LRPSAAGAGARKFRPCTAVAGGLTLPGRIRPGVWLGLLTLFLGGLCLTVLAVTRARLSSPAPTVVLLDREGRFLAEVGDGRDAELGYWPVEHVPERVAAATIAIEDRRFGWHPGVDPLAVGRALVQDLRFRRRVSGASTLAMQVARMQSPGPRSLVRKAVEAVTATLLTWRHGRQALLAHYLRIAPYGNRIHGIAYAARRYLDKPVDDLSWAEIAYLAAIPQAPGRMNPHSPSGRLAAVARGQRILDLLAAQGVITRAEHELAAEQISTLRLPTRETRPAEAMHAVLRLEREYASPERRLALAKTPVIRTSFDLELQRQVQTMAYETVLAASEQGAENAAVMVVDRQTHEVLASVGSTSWNDSARHGAIDYTRVPRSPGSTLKPFIFALGLDLGVITPATVLDDLHRAAGGIANADHRFLGPLLPRVALANSRNVPAVDLLDRIGLDEGYRFLADAGLADDTVAARYYGLGLAVGGMPVTLEKLVRAYTALAGDGREHELSFEARRPGREVARLVSEDAAREVTLFLADPEARLPSFGRMGAAEFPFPVALKTGTSPEDRDAWTVAWSSRYLVGVWVGRPDHRPMTGQTGYACAAGLAHKVLLSLHPAEQSGLADLSFPHPRGRVPVRLCALTGLPASDLCERVLTEWLRPAEIPRRSCDAHVRLALDTSTGGVATARTPARFLKEQTFTILPARYAAWAASHGMAQPPGSFLLVSGSGMLFAGLTGTGGRTGFGERHVTLAIASPRDGSRFMRDPEVPDAEATLGLHAVVEPGAEQVLWMVDGRPFAVADYPFTARWPLSPGEHVIQARLPYTDVVSRPVKVLVQ
jgi:penicillin-binding protein 1C